MNRVAFKREKRDGFNRYEAVITGVDVAIVNYSTKSDHSIICPFRVYIKALPYQYGGYRYRTLKDAKEAAITLATGDLATCDCGL